MAEAPITFFFLSAKFYSNDKATSIAHVCRRDAVTPRSLSSHIKFGEAQNDEREGIMKGREGRGESEMGEVWMTFIKES